ncbi:MAG: metallophosphoesterase, partial [Alphaproteobacteria bacterium]|nr:metallophosphoesterase [Alphaproteobacteria bacterium]
MTMWVIIMWVTIVFVITSLFYISARVPNLLDVGSIAEWGKFKQFSLGLLISLGVTAVVMLCVNFVNAIVCVIYVAMIWAVSDFTFWIIEKVGHVTFEHYYAGWIALIISIIALSAGWYFAHHVWQTNYELKTTKEVPSLKIAMFADSHLGTTFDEKAFSKHLREIQAQNPDILVIVGDYVDDGTSREQLINMTRPLGQL